MIALPHVYFMVILLQRCLGELECLFCIAYDKIHLNGRGNSAFSTLRGLFNHSILMVLDGVW